MALTAVAACLAWWLGRSGRTHPAMNRRLLDILDFSMVRQMRACDKNIANEAGDAAQEQILKNVFISFHNEVYALRRDPALAQMSWPDLTERLERVATETVAAWPYRSQKWATQLLHDAIENAKQVVEKTPPAELEPEPPDRTPVDIACPACATPLTLEHDDYGFSVRLQDDNAARASWSSIDSISAGTVDVFGTCPACGRQITVRLGDQGQHEVSLS